MTTPLLPDLPDHADCTHEVHIMTIERPVAQIDLKVFGNLGSLQDGRHSWVARWWTVGNGLLTVRWLMPRTAVIGPVLTLTAPGEPQPIARWWTNAFAIAREDVVEITIGPKRQLPSASSV